MELRGIQKRTSRIWGAARSYRRQKTLTQENIAQEKRGGGITIKNLLYHVKLKTRVRQLVNDLSSRRWKLLRRNHFKQINDKSFFPLDESRRRLGYYGRKDTEDNQDGEEDEDEEFNETSLAKQLTKQSTRNVRIRNASNNILYLLKRFLDLIPIFNPNSVSKLLWDSFQSCLGLLMSVIVPLKLAIQEFQLSYYVGSPIVLSFMIILIISDILINLNTAFFKKGKIVVMRYVILKNYISQMGLVDALITQALIWELWGSSNSWWEYSQSILLCLLLYFKALKLNKLMFKIEETFSFNRRTLNMLSLAKLLLFILKVSHAFACIWVFIGRQMVARGNSSWIELYQNDGWGSQYLQAYYFISVTMTTIGYGDIVPKNAIETIVCIVSMLLACVIFGYTINIIGSIFMELKKEDEVKKENLLIINRYMTDKNISRDLQSSIREYLEYFWKQQQNDNSEKESHILEQLSEDMRKALLIQANRIILEDCQFFKRHFSRDVLKKGVHLIEQKKLTPNEPIINSYDDQAKSGVIFFVESGEVDIYQEFLLDQIQSDNPNNILDGEDSQTQQNLPQVNINGQPILAPPIPLNILQLATGQQPTQQQQIKTKKQHIKRVKTLKKGEFFGEVSFFTNSPNQFIAKSRNFSKILYIERSSFLEYLQTNHFSDDFETFCYLKDNLVQNQIQPLFTKCYFCSSYDHTALTCSMVHYYPIKTLTISRYNFSQSIMFRTPFNRRKVINKNTLKELYNIEDKADRFLVKNGSFIEKNFFNNCENSEISDSNSQSNEDSLESDEAERSSRQAAAAAALALTHPSRFKNQDNNESDDDDNNSQQNENKSDDDNKKISEDEDEILTSINGEHPISKDNKDCFLFKKDSLLFNKDDLLPNGSLKSQSGSNEIKIKDENSNSIADENSLEKKQRSSSSSSANKSLTQPSQSQQSSQKQVQLSSLLEQQQLLPQQEQQQEQQQQQQEQQQEKQQQYQSWPLKGMSCPRLILPGDPDHINLSETLKKEEDQDQYKFPSLIVSEASNNPLKTSYPSENIEQNQTSKNTGDNYYQSYLNYQNDSNENMNYNNDIQSNRNINSTSEKQSKYEHQYQIEKKGTLEIELQEDFNIPQEGNNQDNLTKQGKFNGYQVKLTMPQFQKVAQQQLINLQKIETIKSNEDKNLSNNLDDTSSKMNRLDLSKLSNPKLSQSDYLDPNRFDKQKNYTNTMNDSIPPTGLKIFESKEYGKEENIYSNFKSEKQSYGSDNQDWNNRMKNIPTQDNLRKQRLSVDIRRKSSVFLRKQQSSDYTKYESKHNPKNQNRSNRKSIINFPDNLKSNRSSISHQFPLSSQQLNVPSNLNSKRQKSTYTEDPRQNSVLGFSGEKNKSRRESISSHSFLFRQSFLSQTPQNNNRKFSTSQFIPPSQANIPETSLQRLRRVSMAFFANPEDKLQKIFPENIMKPQELIRQPSDPQNLQQRMQEAIVRTIGKFMEEERQSPLTQKPSNGVNQSDVATPNSKKKLQKGKNGLLEEEQNQFYCLMDPLQQLFQNWDAKFESDFESMKIFKNYFPLNNIDKVLSKIKKKRIETTNSKLIQKWKRITERKQNTLIMIKDKICVMQSFQSPLKIHGSVSELSEKNNPSQMKVNTQSQIQTDPEIPQSPTLATTITTRNLLGVNINHKKNRFQPIKSSVTSPMAATLIKLKLNKFTEEEDLTFSDDEFQAFEKIPPNTNMSRNNSNMNNNNNSNNNFNTTNIANHKYNHSLSNNEESDQLNARTIFH